MNANRISRALVNDVMQIEKYLTKYSRYHQSVLTIEQFTQFGKNASNDESFKFLRHEIPTRLAHIMQELDHMPKNLLAVPSVKTVRKWYFESFKDLMDFQDTNDVSAENRDRFARILHNIKRRHDATVETMAKGVMELKELEGTSAIPPTVQYFLDRFYMNRIGIRLLMTQHLALFEENLTRSSKSRFIGVFEPNCHVKSICNDAVDNAGLLCEEYYLDVPDVIISEHNSICRGEDIIIAYVPSHLYFVMFELLKNAMRATIETHGDKDQLPPVKVDIVRGDKDLTIRITDEGNGIARSHMENLFMYHYSTAPQPDQDTLTTPMAGYGYGLPLSRLYAKYFGGDLQITSMQGYGSSAYVYLKALSGHAQEVIPLYNSSVKQHYKNDQTQNMVSPRDWSCDSFYDGQIHSYVKASHRSSRSTSSNNRTK
jgi:pyruvate dehydrogenase kinase 2/3/4